jgi:predicted 3-demethylubiquinone-9 3-methyltransferase (glyoxalase superfamily)
VIILAEFTVLGVSCLGLNGGPEFRHSEAFSRALTDALAAGGDEAKRAFEAMMPMKKIDIASIEAARRG